MVRDNLFPPPAPAARAATVAESIRDEALYLARGPFRREMELAHLLRRPDFVARFTARLAWGVANALGVIDPSVQAVYQVDAAAPPRDRPGEDRPLLHLLVVAAAPSTALRTFITALDQALTASLQALPSPRFALRRSVFVVTLVTPEVARRGLGRVWEESSPYAAPALIWGSREATSPSAGR